MARLRLDPAMSAASRASCRACPGSFNVHLGLDRPVETFADTTAGDAVRGRMRSSWRSWSAASGRSRAATGTCRPRTPTTSSTRRSNAFEDAVAAIADGEHGDRSRPPRSIPADVERIRRAGAAGARRRRSSTRSPRPPSELLAILARHPGTEVMLADFLPDVAGAESRVRLRPRGRGRRGRSTRPTPSIRPRRRVLDAIAALRWVQTAVGRGEPGDGLGDVAPGAGRSP